MDAHGLEAITSCTTSHAQNCLHAVMRLRTVLGCRLRPDVMLAIHREQCLGAGISPARDAIHAVTQRACCLT